MDAQGWRFVHEVNGRCCIPCTYTGDKKNCSWFEIGRQMGHNHISAAGGIMNAVKSVDAYLKQKNLEISVEKVERRTLEEVLEYVSESKTRLARTMLENVVVPLENEDVDITMLRDAVELISGRVETEASGNVTIETGYKIGQSGITFISSGVLTHSVKALDIYISEERCRVGS
ncbi:hypothetical protein Bca4012_010001 [Brassica carinata]